LGTEQLLANSKFKLDLTFKGYGTVIPLITLHFTTYIVMGIRDIYFKSNCSKNGLLTYNPSQCTKQQSQNGSSCVCTVWNKREQIHGTGWHN